MRALPHATVLGFPPSRRLVPPPKASQAVTLPSPATRRVSPGSVSKLSVPLEWEKGSWLVEAGHKKGLRWTLSSWESSSNH